jgi:glycine/D-amino acid oxidase-like deaminating enzyme
VTGVDYESSRNRTSRASSATDAYVGARLYRHHCGLHPAKYASELARCVLLPGRVICESTAFLSCDCDRRRLRDQDAGRRIRARELIVATNGYSGDRPRSLRRRVVR